eukprot:jgi/Tetstr1/442376/TSEL_030502.t1
MSPQGAIDDLLAVRPLRTHRRDSDADSDNGAEGIVAGIEEGNPSNDSRSDSDGEGDAGAGYDFNTGTSGARGKYDDRTRRRQLYTGADATLMEAALNLCEWNKLKHNIKTAAFERCQDMPSSNRREKRNMKKLIIILVHMT